MVSISRELPTESEARLRRVLRATDIEHLPGHWCFRRLTGAPPPDALATVRDADGWCALTPAEGEVAEPFGLTLSTFPPGIDNSGYIGWVSTTLKERTGSGVFVVCGDNPRRGGVFDYLGYPAEAADAVRGVLDDLRRPPSEDRLGLDLRVFEVAETSGASAISPDTRFEFRERDGRVEARYSGGAVDQGFLVGRREDDRVTTAYSQVDAAGHARAGTAVMRLTGDGDGGLLLVEDFTWSDGATGRNVLRAAGGTRAR
ncbi:hypothetical protein DFP74_5831 [Nocardiopsis sp. Huas11]|uniref:DUF6196 family protein n=1 Tax=Nocardiopsis sp. Huas11 TaxID=2183912 RepID=UPI000F1C5141|nr:DUF6196 family protein [Nocardiopsis sp. Huas11]RKS10079.1 hypothetical protein DFP74_5831 [Nocardiopsis sp. Huas11]